MKSVNIIFVAVTFLALVHLGLSQTDDEALIVDAGVLGKIRGSNGRTAADNGVSRDYIQFRGIPYASVGERFMPSRLLEVPLTVPGETYNATMNGPSCFQPLLPPVLMSEDCLSINVYTHSKYTGDDRQLRPVLFFIHGGAFTIGGGGSFSGLRLLNRDIVYVSFNYRLGLNGFFSLGNENVPGNAGMYDVVNALKWTKQFIRHFGGNPDLITISGQSAGSVTVTQLMASPIAQGLFQGAIGASGSALNAWGTSVDHVKESLVIANFSGCYNPETSPTPDLAMIAYCMRSIPDPIVLVDALYKYQVTERQAGRLGFSVVSPVVQDFPMTSYPKFLPKHPREVFEDGEQADVPLMMGATKHDGSYVFGVLYNRFLKDNNLTDDANFLRDELVSAALLSLGIEDEPFGVHEAIAKNYLGNATHSGNFNEMFPGLMDIFSTFFFKGDTYQTAQYHSKVNSTYWYSFDYMGSVTLFPSLFPGSGEVPPFPGGVTHTDDLIYVFSLTFSPFTEVDALISSRMLDYWADFATMGDPTPSGSNNIVWPKLDDQSHKYMSINTVSTEQSDYRATFVGPGMELVK